MSMHSRYRESPRSTSPRARASSAWPEIPATLQPIVRSLCSSAAIRSSSSAASSSLPALRSASAMMLRSCEHVLGGPERLHHRQRLAGVADRERPVPDLGGQSAQLAVRSAPASTDHRSRRSVRGRAVPPRSRRRRHRRSPWPGWPTGGQPGHRRVLVRGELVDAGQVAVARVVHVEQHRDTSPRSGCPGGCRRPSAGAGRPQPLGRVAGEDRRVDDHRHEHAAELVLDAPAPECRPPPAGRGPGATGRAQSGGRPRSSRTRRAPPPGASSRPRHAASSAARMTPARLPTSARTASITADLVGGEQPRQQLARQPDGPRPQPAADLVGPAGRGELLESVLAHRLQEPVAHGRRPRARPAATGRRARRPTDRGRGRARASAPSSEKPSGNIASARSAVRSSLVEQVPAPVDHRLQRLVPLGRRAVAARSAARTGPRAGGRSRPRT